MNKDSKILTPNIDQIAKDGIRFTDAHSGSAVCTPTRYGILTGSYCWRTRLKSGVLWGYSFPLIEPGRVTVGSMLKEHGYRTGCVGKWHLGLGWANKVGTEPNKYSVKAEDVDYTQPIKGGPVDLGFDYFYGIPASLDMAPYVYIENDRVIEAPTERVEAMGGQAYWRAGPCAPGFKHEEVLPKLTEKAVEFIDNHAKQKNDKPFFLYFPLNSPHTPCVPTPEFAGKSGLNAYADFVMQTDWTVGKVIEALERNGFADNTLIIFTSDNGCSPQADFKFLHEHGHHPSYVYRGYKSDAWDGGHRVPFVARWPSVIKAGSVSDETICLTDLMATSAAIVGQKLSCDTGQDSYNILPALKGQKVKGGIREAAIHCSIDGKHAIRQGDWKLVLCKGSGGWSMSEKDAPEDAPAGQLYNMTWDIGEKNNLYNDRPDIVAKLTSLLEKYKKQGYSRPMK